MLKRKSRKAISALTTAAMLAAMSIVCGKYLAIPVGNVMRFSFENLPIILSGMMFGPIMGALTGVVADLFGCLLVGYTINPLVTLGAFSIGLLSGIICKLVPDKRSFVKIVLCVIPAHIVGSVIIKTVGLAAFYSMPLYLLMLWRALNYIIVGALEILALHFISKNRFIHSMMFKNGRR